jgi:hypothetical protein
MTLNRSTVRWVASPVLALASVALAQVVSFQAVVSTLVVALGPSALDPGNPGIWAAKTIASVVMGAAFVSTTWWVAPGYKSRTAVVAFACVLLWSVALSRGAFVGGFFPWLIAMAVAGAIGAGGALWLTRSRFVASPSTAS